MTAFVMRRIGEAGPMDKPVPEIGPNHSLIKTTAALICTSDTHSVGGAIGERENVTLGHEAVGVIARIGSAVHGFKEGDRAAVKAITTCYACEGVDTTIEAPGSEETFIACLKALAQM